ncbi:helix-turn-helix transcriptional regulator [Paenibacillus sp. GYB003]|uniref:helix-turn-helix transcriptional regulator n=1 Tax=Paenibacillus sp. GYB003 TaxID=2994392 RepID=UPI002F966B49
MSGIPVYQDCLALGKFGDGQLPFYILHFSKMRTQLHHHDFVELFLVVGGSGFEIINGYRHVLRPGTVSFLLPHHIHYIQSHPDAPLEIYSCMFDMNILFHSTCDLPIGHDLLTSGQDLPSHYELNAEQTKALEQIMIRLTEEYDSDKYGRESIIRAKLIEALVLVVRTHREKRNPPAPTVPGSKNNIWDIVRFVHMRYNEPITLNSLARTFNWSPSYISRSFKEHVGETFIKYLHMLRIVRAASLLSTSTMSISAISAEVGFEHFRTFFRVFKEIKGMSPKEYRRKHLKSRP